MNKRLIDPVMIGLTEIGFLRDVTAVAELRFSVDQQVLLLLGFVRRMAVQTAQVTIWRALNCRMPLLHTLAVAAHALLIDFLFRETRESDDLADLAAPSTCSDPGP